MTFDPSILDSATPEELDQLQYQLSYRRALEAAANELTRRRWLANPISWAEERLQEFVWSKQREVMGSVRDNRLTAVRSAHTTGKALRNGTPVLTDKGWVPIEGLSVGDMVFDRFGKLTKVIGVWPQGIRPLYRMTFSDGVAIDTDRDHLWTVWASGYRSEGGRERLLTTMQLSDSCNFMRWQIPSPPPELPTEWQPDKRTSCHRTISSVERVDSDYATCISVNSPTSCFVTQHHIVTHNSFIAARIACWWIDTHPPGEAFVITTADTWKQVEAVLWRELRRAHAKGKLRGRTNRTEWLMPLPGGDGRAEELVAMGHRPADTDPTAFHGIHAPFVLVIFDEAGGLPKALWDSADSLVSNEDSRFLAIGNPDDPVTEFAEVSKPGSGWNSIRISAFDSPNVTRCVTGVHNDTGKPCGWEGPWNGGIQHEDFPWGLCPSCGDPLPEKEVVPDLLRKSLVSWSWVSQKQHSWGRSNPLYISKVLGEFPEFNTDSLIPMHWLRDAQKRWAETPYGTPIELGVDVGGGGDKNVIALRRGIKVEIVHEDREPDTGKTKGQVLIHLRNHGATCAKVDYIGIGRGAVDIAKGEGHPFIGVQVGDPAVNTEAYANLRAEGFWRLRECFQNGTIALDPADMDTAAQLLELRWKPTLNGRILIESKDSMKTRGKNSPDRADAVMLAMLPVSLIHRDMHVTWGRDLPKKKHSLVEPEYAPRSSEW